ncbi:hypothetical protein RFI_12678 [Reticulomyxa filosa]|uniref:Uncharacterized protein n=1 Tax=Reticulomyxa filosa TaxID=46433 RepID=X6NFG6_RETFI|nr:hypothetical protein RFI_12678 [Reticulomyxa filosa]|eukprot:ETO24479.1 hypothetical protein RFI_12678 [Reticulomyxa filosa]
MKTTGKKVEELSNESTSAHYNDNDDSNANNMNDERTVGQSQTEWETRMKATIAELRMENSQLRREKAEHAQEMEQMRQALWHREKRIKELESDLNYMKCMYMPQGTQELWPRTSSIISSGVMKDILDMRLKQRPNWSELHQRGILLDDPTSRLSEDVQQMGRTLKRRRASTTIQDFLPRRPLRSQLEQLHILETGSANMNMNMNVNSQHNHSDHPDHDQILQMLQSADSLLKASDQSLQNNKKELKRRLERKISERPTIHETIARGIMYTRPDTAWITSCGCDRTS